MSRGTQQPNQAAVERMRFILEHGYLDDFAPNPEETPEAYEWSSMLSEDDVPEDVRAHNRRLIQERRERRAK